MKGDLFSVDDVKTRLIIRCNGVKRIWFSKSREVKYEIILNLWRKRIIWDNFAIAAVAWRPGNKEYENLKIAS